MGINLKMDRKLREHKLPAADQFKKDSLYLWLRHQNRMKNNVFCKQTFMSLRKGSMKKKEK